MSLCVAVLQSVLTFAVEGEGPVRFGFPVSESDLRLGLRVEGPGRPRLQWRRLQARPDPVTRRTWVELAIAPARGTLRILAGGVAEDHDGDGPVLRRRTEVAEADGTRTTTREILWACGDKDTLERTTWLADATLQDGETLHAGESLTRPSPTWDARWLRVRIPRAEFEEAGLLPQDQGLAKALRGELLRTVALLPPAPGQRGAGDYLRDGGVVTNLEFDTTLGLARLGLATMEQELLRRALAAARHLGDIDLDSGSGLPFVHGKDHRGAAPEPGHAWLRGVLLVGCLAADDALIATARTLAWGLAAVRPVGEGRFERARDLGWPLQEVQAWLAFADDAGVASRASALVAELVRRYDKKDEVVRFGEGVRKRGFYEERCWITGGVLVPALRASLVRHRDPLATAVLHALQAGLVRRIANGRPGLPVRAFLFAGATLEELRLSGVPEVALTLEGVAPDLLPALLQRSSVRKALVGILREDDPDLATTWSMVARCEWVLR